MKGLAILDLTALSAFFIHVDIINIGEDLNLLFKIVASVAVLYTNYKVLKNQNKKP